MKKLFSVLLTLVILTASVVPVHAVTMGQVNAADAMNDLGLFLGTGKGYELNNQLTRAQGITMLVRMIGKEAEAQKNAYGDPFKDVDTWAKGYVGYAWANKITNGVSADRFDPNGTMTDYMFLTLTLRALGYEDEADHFVWNDPYDLAKSVGLIRRTTPDGNFTRGEAVEVFWNAMNANLKGKTATLADSLIAQKVFTADEFAEAVKVQVNGREEGAGKPAGSTDTTPPETPDSDGDTNPSETPGKVTFEKYEAMSGEEQEAFFESFEDPEDFFAWYNNAKAEYDARNPNVEIDGNGSIDLGGLVGDNG